MNNLNKEEVQRYLSMDEDELYRLLAPTQESDLFNDPQAQVSRGKGIFNSTFRQVHSAVCAEYQAHKDRIRTAIDMTGLVTGVLMAAPAAYGLPLIPFAVIVVKTGLEELCSGDSTS